MDNIIQSFQVEEMNLRGRIVRMDHILDEIISQHNYPEWVGFALAEALLVNAALASSIKMDGKLSLQIQSEGAIKLIATDFFAQQDGEPPMLRGYVKFDEERKARGEPDFKNGVFGVVIDLGDNMQPYQGLARLEGGITESAKAYFRDSEQLPTDFETAIFFDALKKQWHGGLIMIQHMASIGGKNAHEGSGFEEAKMRISTTEREELVSDELTAQELVYRLFHDYNPTANPPLPIRFGCQCSEERVRNSLSIYSAKDLTHMTNDEGRITADCQFCGRHYDLDPQTVGFEAKKD